MAIDNGRTIYRGRLIDVVVRETVLPNGTTMTVEAVQHPGAAAVVAFDDSGNVILIRQFRPVIGNLLSAPGYSAERVALFLARDLVPREAALDAHELVSVVAMPFDEALALVRNGAISDAKTVAGLLLAGERVARA